MRPPPQIKRGWGLLLHSSTIKETQLNAIYDPSFPRSGEEKNGCEGHDWET